MIGFRNKAATRPALATVFSVVVLALAGCGGGGGGVGVLASAAGTTTATTTPSTSASTSATNAPQALAAGSTMTLAADSSVLVPAGTTVQEPNGSSITINGSSNTIYVQAGTTVSVPASATGSATNLVATGTAGSSSTASGSSAIGTGVNVSVLAGSATASEAPTDGTGTGAELWGGGRIAIDRSTGNLFISDQGKIKQVTQAGVVTTIQPSGGATGINRYFGGVAVDNAHNVFAGGEVTTYSGGAATYAASIWKLTASGSISDFAPGWASSTTNINMGTGALAMDGSGNLYYADALGYRILKFTPDGAMSVLAGSGAAGSANGVGTAASFENPTDLAIDPAGNLIVVDGSAGVRKITPDGTVSTLNSGEDILGIAIDDKGDIFLSGGIGITRVDPSGSVTRFSINAGSNLLGALACDASGALYVDTRGIGAQILKITFD